MPTVRYVGSTATVAALMIAVAGAPGRSARRSAASRDISDTMR